jgi:FAD dependent monooxygenase
MAQTDPTSAKPFRVIIIGAGNVGLSFSHALQLANIEHVVLEKHDKIVSIRGAALSIWPSVARIFDQFGILDNIAKATTPISRECQRWPDGSLSWHGDMMQSMGNLYVVMVSRPS